MSRTFGALLIIAILGYVPGAKAAGTNVKCALNEDRVWVYESVVDFNLAAKLKCGEPVEIIGRIKGYVKIQTQAGVEGYVADTAFPKSALPPEPAEKPNDVESASVAALAHHSAAPGASVLKSAPATTTAAPTIAKSNSAPAGSSLPATASIVTPSASATTAAAKPQPPIVTPEVKPQPVITTSTPAVPSEVAATTAPAPQREPVEITLSTVPAAGPAIPAPAPASSPVVSVPATPAASSQPEPEPAVAYAANASNVAPDVHAIAVTHPSAAASNPDDDEDSMTKPSVDATAGCTHFFSAYGLSPNQYKWIAQNRKKAFPSVCPAPTPSMVDFVVIFTHDVAFYNVTMPTAVHVDSNGFSDWTPMSTVDTALMTQSEANSSHHEYVWVFHTNRGAFDPSKFSARRRPLFSKGETNVLGSHGGYKTVMDALTYIETNTANR